MSVQRLTVSRNNGIFCFWLRIYTITALADSMRAQKKTLPSQSILVQTTQVAAPYFSKHATSKQYVWTARHDSSGRYNAACRSNNRSAMPHNHTDYASATISTRHNTSITAVRNTSPATPNFDQGEFSSILVMTTRSGKSIKVRYVTH